MFRHALSWRTLRREHRRQRLEFENEPTGRAIVGVCYCAGVWVVVAIAVGVWKGWFTC